MGVYEGSTIIILKWGSTGEVSNSFVIPSQGVPYSRSTPIWGTRSRGGIKIIPGMQVTRNSTGCMYRMRVIPPDSKKTDKTFLCEQFSSDFKTVDTYGKRGSFSRGLQNIIHLSSFPTMLWLFPRGMSEWAARGAKKPNFCSHGHSFSSINNPETVLEISAGPEISVQFSSAY